MGIHCILPLYPCGYYLLLYSCIVHTAQKQSNEHASLQKFYNFDYTFLKLWNTEIEHLKFFLY